MTLGDQILQVFISGVTAGCVIAMVGVAIVFFFSVTRFFDISLGNYLMLGAMIVSVLLSSGMNLGLSILLALAIPLALGLVLWRILLYGPSQRFPVLTIIMITIGIALWIEGVAFLVFGTQVRLAPYYLNINPIRLFGATMSPQAPVIYGALVLAILALSFLLGRTLLGKALRACHEQTLASRLMGINTKHMMYFSFCLAVVISCIGGIAIAPLTAATYSMGMQLMIKGFLVALVGGARVEGALAGGLLLGIVESLAAAFISSSYALIISLTIFVIILLCKPSGLLGSSEIEH